MCSYVMATPTEIGALQKLNNTISNQFNLRCRKNLLLYIYVWNPNLFFQIHMHSLFSQETDNSSIKLRQNLAFDKIFWASCCSWLIVVSSWIYNQLWTTTIVAFAFTKFWSNLEDIFHWRLLALLPQKCASGNIHNCNNIPLSVRQNWYVIHVFCAGNKGMHQFLTNEQLAEF